MKPSVRHPSVRRAAGALLLVSVGVIVGTYLPTTRPARQPPPPVAAASTPDSAAAATPAVPSAAQPQRVDTLPDAGVPPAPGFESFLAGSPRPAFGGEYAVLRGAETAGETVPRASPPSTAVPTIPPAPSVPVDGARAAAAGHGDTAAAASSSARRAPERFRPSPAQGIPRGIALGNPLLAVARPGGRVAFHDLGVRGGPTPAGIEGEWAVVGRCDTPMRVEFALPARRAGELRAIGRADATAGSSVEPVVARQACAAAAERYRRPRTATESERAAFAAVAAAAGFAPAELHQVADAHATRLLVFRRPGDGSAVVAAARGPGGAEVLWTHTAAADDGDLTLLGVYREGAGAEAWITIGDARSPRALLVASSPDGRAWTAAGPVPLRDP